jgi:phage baseplate assembly protein gpV
MYIPSLDQFEQNKHAMHEIANQKTFVLEGVVTSVDTNPPYKVKVMLEPYGVESDWLNIATPYIGNGYGFVFPAPEEGTLVYVLFPMGDIGKGTVISGIFNDYTQMPTVPNGTAGLYHKSGSSFFIAQDGSMKMSHPSGSSLSIGTDGLVTIKGKNQTQSW